MSDGTATAMFRLQARPYFSTDLAQAAALFARSSAQPERTGDVLPSNETLADHRSHVTGAAITAASFLEATINELFSDAYQARRHGQRIERIDPLAGDVIEGLAAKWASWESAGGKRPAIVPKFQAALTITGKETFAEDDRSYGDVTALVQLRDALLHYKPGWSRGDVGADVDPRKMASILDKRFPTNPFSKDQSFPGHYLGHGCAAWVLRSAITFADAFFQRMGLPAPYGYVRYRLNTE